MQIVYFLLCLMIVIMLCMTRGGRITLFAVAVAGASVLAFFWPA